MEVKINVKEMNSAIEDQAGRVNTSEVEVALNSILPFTLTKDIQNNKKAIHKDAGSEFSAGHVCVRQYKTNPFVHLQLSSPIYRHEQNHGARIPTTQRISKQNGPTLSKTRPRILL